MTNLPPHGNLAPRTPINLAEVRRRWSEAKNAGYVLTITARLGAVDGAKEVVEYCMDLKNKQSK